MDKDWKLLSQLREARQAAAIHAVARERRAVEDCRAQAEAAARELASHQAARAVLQRQTIAALAQGNCGVESLVHAGAWSRTLGARIEQASRSVEQAQSVVTARVAELDTRRGELRAAAQRLAQVKQVHAELHKSEQRERGVRAEQAVDELASQAWQRRARGSPSA